jgi:hypothetical protein
MADAPSFSKFVPGFDFLQGLLKNAGSKLPHMGQWIAPTLDPQELDKRIEELKTVQFWLEQNAKMLAATIQALEVQRMTLSTLKSMNVPLAPMAEAFKLRPAGGPEGATAAAGLGNGWPMPNTETTETTEATEPASPPARATARVPKAVSATKKASARSATAHPAGKTASPSPAADPMQWWGALTQQFSQLAAQALKDSRNEVGKAAVSAVAKRGLQTASATLKGRSRSASKPGARKKPR